MVKSLRVLLLALLAFASLNAVARTPVPVINHENVSISSPTGKPLSMAQVKQAIHNAAAAKQWSVVDQGPGKILATLHVRGKHTAVTQITYSPDKYSVVYNDSQNLNYSGGPDGRGTIHPFYNRWVQDLSEAIRLSLNKG
jgi:hypothetical protein